MGRSWRETDKDPADRDTLIRDPASGEFNRPVRIVAFNIADGWSRDVDIADEMRRRYAEFGEVPDSVLEFIDPSFPLSRSIKVGSSAAHLASAFHPAPRPFSFSLLVTGTTVLPIKDQVWFGDASPEL